MSFDRMIEKIVETQNPTVAGLDPKLAYIPSYILDGAVAKYGKTLEAAAAALLEYNKGLIDALCDIVPAVKPQAAYYEMYGWAGVRTEGRITLLVDGNVRHHRRQAQRHRHHDGSLRHGAPRQNGCVRRENGSLRCGRADREWLPRHGRHQAAARRLRSGR